MLTCFAGLFESCCGGGGRFDAGMLYYSPQIWGSDTTDPIERLHIQYGASFGFPISCIGSHVSAVPNHQTGRTTPLATRASVAMFGAFGYELDPSKLSQAEKTAIQQQIAFYQSNYELIQYGDYYRLTAPSHPSCVVWETVEPSGITALITAVYHHVQVTPVPVRVRVQGLLEGTIYTVSVGETTYQASGSALCQCGLVIPPAKEEYQAYQIVLTSRGDGNERSF